MLLNKGANVDLQNGKALCIAIQLDNKHIVKLLLDNLILKEMDIFFFRFTDEKLLLLPGEISKQKVKTLE